ncbi:MAG: hypothetical protein JWP01_879 [Myxococcales bacterium]|nr:hypothetical protein [Myxococcales bacterium]
MRLFLASAYLLIACTKSAPGPTVPPGAVAVKRAPVVQAPSCADAGVMLRGEVANEDADGKDKEAVIAKVCTTDAWSPKILACIASASAPTTCLEGLSEQQRTAYGAAVAQWHATHGYAAEGEGEEGGEYGMDDPPPYDEEDWITCGTAVTHSESFPPIVTLTNDADRKLATSLRGHELASMCTDDEWDMTIRQCMVDATATTIGACIQQLDRSEQNAITAKLTTLDKVIAKALTLATKPAKVGCKQVVGVHYADARWKAMPAELKGADRKQAIAESRTRMTKACTTEQWPAVDRACVVAGGGEACFALSGRANRWSFPAAGVLVKTGIPQCDAYGAAIMKLTACPGLDVASQDAMLGSYTMSAMYWLKMVGDQRTAVAAACDAAKTAIREAAVSSNCPL